MDLIGTNTRPKLKDEILLTETMVVIFGSLPKETSDAMVERLSKTGCATTYMIPGVINPKEDTKVLDPAETARHATCGPISFIRHSMAVQARAKHIVVLMPWGMDRLVSMSDNITTHQFLVRVWELMVEHFSGAEMLPIRLCPLEEFSFFLQPVDPAESSGSSGSADSADSAETTKTAKTVNFNNDIEAKTIFDAGDDRFSKHLFKCFVDPAAVADGQQKETCSKERDKFWWAVDAAIYAAQVWQCGINGDLGSCTWTPDQMLDHLSSI